MFFFCVYVVIISKNGYKGKALMTDAVEKEERIRYDMRYMINIVHAYVIIIIYISCFMTMCLAVI